MNRLLAKWGILAAILSTGCAAPLVQPTNLPLAPGTPRGMGAPQHIVGENGIALAFSGGGLRAAAFSHGVLEALAAVSTPEGDLLDDVTFIGSVSGGSLTAAWHGLNGREGLGRFRQEVLLRDFESDMRLAALLPWNLARIAAGGLNTRENFGDILDKHVFRGATFADMYRRPKPDIRIHASDLYHRIAFPFIPRAFEVLCSDLPSYGVADAVSASMAVPLVFAPVVLRTYPEDCREPLSVMLDRVRADPDTPKLARATESAMRAYRESGRTQYVRLVDGGLTDNFGVSSLLISRALLATPYAPLTDRDAVKVRRMLFMLVDASRGPRGDWIHDTQGPAGVDIALYATDAAIDAAARLAADVFARTVQDWRDALVRHRCSLPLEEVRRLGGPSDWRCDDVKFTLEILSVDSLPEPYRKRVETIPTRLTLDATQIDATLEAGRSAVQASRRIREYVQERVPAPR